MKYLIASDFHLSETNRLDDFISRLYEIQLVADRIKPDKYIIAGDIFDSRKPTPLELKVFSEHLKMVKCDKEIIPGNHDILDKSLTTLDWYDSTLKDPKVIEDGKFKILITHCGVKEMKIGALNLNFKSEKSYKDYKEYDVVIFGHIHKPQVLNKKNPLAFCPGSIDKVTFGERDDEKYLWILNINDKIKLQRYKQEKWFI
jgi:putative phosphoesterase